MSAFVDVHSVVTDGTRYAMKLLRSEPRHVVGDSFSEIAFADPSTRSLPAEKISPGSDGDLNLQSHSIGQYCSDDDVLPLDSVSNRSSGERVMELSEMIAACEKLSALGYKPEDALGLVRACLGLSEVEKQSEVSGSATSSRARSAARRDTYFRSMSGLADGDGMCYLRLIKFSSRVAISGVLGARPTFSDLMRLTDGAFSFSNWKDLWLSSTGVDRLYHVSDQWEVGARRWIDAVAATAAAFPHVVPRSWLLPGAVVCGPPLPLVARFGFIPASLDSTVQPVQDVDVDNVDVFAYVGVAAVEGGETRSGCRLLWERLLEPGGDLAVVFVPAYACAFVNGKWFQPGARGLVVLSRVPMCVGSDLSNGGGIEAFVEPYHCASGYGWDNSALDVKVKGVEWLVLRMAPELNTINESSSVWHQRCVCGGAEGDGCDLCGAQEGHVRRGSYTADVVSYLVNLGAYLWLGGFKLETGEAVALHIGQTVSVVEIEGFAVMKLNDWQADWPLDSVEDQSVPFAVRLGSGEGSRFSCLG